MNGLVTQIEKAKPFFEKISRNKYLRAIRDGFLSAMPIVLFSSIFMLLAFIPNIFGFYWSETVENLIIKPYDYSMGILGLLVAGTTAKSLTDSFNRELDKNKEINNVSTMLAGIVGFLLLAVDTIDGGLSTSYMGTTGLMSSFLSAFIVVNIYNLFIKNNIAIKMPEEVPPNIAQTFTDILPFATSTLIIYLIDLLVRSSSGVGFAQTVIELFQPLFTAADSFLGVSLIYGAISFFWFIGIHGPSIVEPATSAIIYANLEENLQSMQAGNQAANVLTPGTQQFVATFGGTGATLVVPFMFMLLGKSKQNKAIGQASFIPTLFGVNEPILFGGPLVLNPIFFIPFFLAPLANVWLFKLFVDLLGMNSFVYNLPWTTPGPIGLILGTAFDPLAFVLAVIMIVVDVAIYYPFFKAYDLQRIEQEEQDAVEVEQSTVEENIVEQPEEIDSKKDATQLEDAIDVDDAVSVLVLCAGGGTSGLLANALTKGAEEYDVPISADGGTYGSHYDILKDYDLVVLAPQVASNYEDIKKDTDKLGVKLVKTKGAEYIGLTRDSKGSLDFVLNIIKIK